MLVVSVNDSLVVQLSGCGFNDFMVCAKFCADGNCNISEIICTNAVLSGIAG